MDHLWSPWRMAYLRNTDLSPSGPTGCIFCDKPAEDRDAENLIVHRGASAFVMLNLYPYNNGHMLIVPYPHVPSFEALPPATLGEIMALANAATATLRRMYHPEAFNLGANIGAPAGAGIAAHVHLHVVPRWTGDTNFMATVGSTRVIPEDLHETYRLARQHWAGPDEAAPAGGQ